MRSTIRIRRNLILIVSVAACSILMPAVFLPNWDVAWHFEMAQRLLEGRQLYAEIIEVNFPLAVYIYLPAVWLSNLAGGSPFLWLSCGITLCVLVNLAVADSFLLRATDSDNWNWWVVQAGIAIVLIVLPASDFGQREHLAVLLTLPYLVARLFESSEPDDATYGFLVPLSLIAGIGFALKPHFVLPWIVTQIVVTRGNWNPRNISLIVLTAIPMAVQLVTIPMLFPDLVRLYQTFGHEYAAFWHRSRYVILFEYLYIPVATLVFIASARLVRPDRRIIVQGLAWVSLAWFVTGVVQGKGWSYHFLPAHMTLVLSGWLAVVIMEESRRRTAVRGLLIASLALVGMNEIQRGVARPDYPARRTHLPSEIKTMPRGMRALVLSVRTSTAFPLLNELGARNIGSISALWPVQAVYGQAGHPGQFVPVRLPEDMTEPESILFEAVVKDMVVQKPELILVSDGTDPLFNDAYLDYLAYFSQDEAFRQEMSHYVRGPRLGHVQFYIRGNIERR